MKLDGIWVSLGVVAVAAGIFYVNQTRQSDVGTEEIRISQNPDRQRQCTSLAGEPAERLKSCLGDLTPLELSSPARKMVGSLGKQGKVLMIGGGLGEPIEGVEMIGLGDVSDLDAVALDTDEKGLNEAFREAGVRAVVIHRDVTQALDRDRVVLSRLAHHDHLEWFQLRYVTEEAFVYTVRNSPTRVPLKTGKALLKGLRARLEGRKAKPQPWKPSAVRLIGVARLQGNSLVVRHAVGNNVELVLDELADKMRRRWEREVTPDGLGHFDDRLHEMRLEVHVVMERAAVEPRSRFAIFDLWELGMDGMMFRHREGVKNDKFTYMPGSEAAVRSMRSGDAFLRYSVKQGGWRDERPWEDKSTRLDIIRTVHFMESERGGGDAVRLVRGFPEVKMSDVDDRGLQQMLIDGGEWWLTNLKKDNSFEYKYWPTQNRRSTEYNEVRHILAARDLADTWRYRQDPRYLDGSRRAMDWLLKYQVHDTDPVDKRLPHPPAGSMLFRYPSFAEAPQAKKPANQKLGTVAVALLGWIAWAEATGSKAEDENIRKMAEYTLSQLEDNGKFRAYYVYKGHPYFHEKNDIVPGEAALALGEVAEYFDEPEWLDFYPKFLKFYQPWFRSRKVKTNPYGRWPHETYDNQTRLDLVQFGPWAVMASKQYYRMTGDEEAAKFGLEIADWMIDYYQWTGERSPWPDYVGGYYKLPEELPAMQTFCYSEGTAAAYTIAALWKPEVKPKYEVATRESLRFLGVMQYDDLDSYFLADPAKVRGGIKYAINENKIRIDYVGHGLSTVSQFLDAREMDPAETLDIVDPAVRATYPAFGGAPPND